jgi:hypothetical protein
MPDCPFCPLMRLDRAEPVAVDGDGLPVLIAGIGSCEDCALIADLFATAPFLISQLAAPIATFFDGLYDLLVKCEWYVGEDLFVPPHEITHFETGLHGVDFAVSYHRRLHVHVLDYFNNKWEPCLWEYMEVSRA